MSSVVCTNPACAQTVRLPADAPAGRVYGCPHCKQPLPPVPAPSTASAGVAGWTLCAIVTMMIAVYHVVLANQARTVLDQAAASASAAAWTVSIYVFARCVEKAARR